MKAAFFVSVALVLATAAILGSSSDQSWCATLYFLPPVDSGPSGSPDRAVTFSRWRQPVTLACEILEQLNKKGASNLKLVCIGESILRVESSGDPSGTNCRELLDELRKTLAEERIRELDRSDFAADRLLTKEYLARAEDDLRSFLEADRGYGDSPILTENYGKILEQKVAADQRQTNWEGLVDGAVPKFQVIAGPEPCPRRSRTASTSFCGVAVLSLAIWYRRRNTPS